MQQGSSALLAGKTALVTGAARRVGAVTARTLHGAGANVVLHYRHSAGEAAELARELNDLRAGSATLVQADLLDVSRMPQLVEATIRAFGRLDILVNNASTFYPTPVGAISEAHWEDLLGSNLKAPLFLTQAAAAALRASEGLVINMADIHGLRPLGDYTVYSVAKAGLIMLTRSLARELAPQVRVNAIAPGPVMWAEIEVDEATRNKIIERTLLKRLGSPEDVARAIRFLATEGAYITGQIIPVDGGRSVAW